MNKSSFKRPQLPQAQLPQAPLIDVVFILLIFFLLSWKFSKDELDLDIRIPTSSQGNSEQRLAGEIIINLKFLKSDIRLFSLLSESIIYKCKLKPLEGENIIISEGLSCIICLRILSVLWCAF